MVLITVAATTHIIQSTSRNLRQTTYITVAVTTHITQSTSRKVRQTMYITVAVMITAIALLPQNNMEK